MKERIKTIPLIGPLLSWLKGRTVGNSAGFEGSQSYWISRYASGGNSGSGSYHELAAFKAEALNEFMERKRISSVIEFGCGDGNQLKLAKYRKYLGLDVSPGAIERCKELFVGDPSKSFLLMSEYKEEKAECALSLDVIYHLVEDDVYTSYMQTLFSAAEKFVVIYSSNRDEPLPGQGPHERQRCFTDGVKLSFPEWQLIEQIKNRYPMSEYGSTGSSADFYIYAKT